MNTFTILPTSSSLSLPNAYPQHTPLSFTSHNPRSNFKLQSITKPQRTSLVCNCKKTGQDSVPGEEENRSVLDAFFLGKALAEVINERLESTVGEVLSTLGKIQAEQQKQVQQIQEEVLERAKKAKDRAARETMEAQGIVPSTPGTINQKPAAVVVASVTTTSTFDSKGISNENLSGFSGSSVDSESSSSSDEDGV